jgi:leucyl/phenylalanyl-tRNA--protein transferase
MKQLYWLDESLQFPDVECALAEPNGLLAIGGDLSPQRLLCAYQQGIFPWYDDSDQPILWWSPSPRAVLFPDKLHISRSLAKTLKKSVFDVSFDRAFDTVIAECAGKRPQASGTWICEDMRAAYNALHQLGFAHSVEVWQEGKLVGGLYGVALGQVFFGESMFSRVSNASKVGFVTLVKKLKEWDYQLIDCQVESTHLSSLGAELIERETFSSYLERYIQLPLQAQSWQGLDTNGETGAPR